MKSAGNKAIYATLSIATLLSLVALGLGIWLAIWRQQWALLPAGAVSLVLSLIGWSVFLGISAVRREAQNTVDQLTAPIHDRLQQLAVLVTQISEQQLLSDRAKSVAYRSNDREALRRAIREDMAAQDWEAARVLADEMESQFGYRQEATRLREEIHAKRDELVRRKIAEVVAVIDRYTRTEQWGAAIRETEKLAETYGDHELVRELPAEIEKRREAMKQQLLAQWHGRNVADYDSSIELLKRLDIYLSPQEAETLQDSVRGLFKAKLESLRTLFGAAWQEQRYADALTVAEQIISDFPNARIAQEVAEKMNVLRQRAAEEKGAAPQTAGA